VVTQTAEANGKAAPSLEGRLTAVANELAGLMTGESTPQYDVIEFALAHHGIIEPSPHLVVVRASGDDPQAVANELAQRLPPLMASNRFVRLGVGSAPAGDGAQTIVIALQESGIETTPIARRADLGSDVSLRGKVLHPFGPPHVYVTDAGGKVTDVPLTRDGQDGFRLQLRCSTEGRIKVEITADDDAGSPSVLANFPIWCGQDPPETLALPDEPAGEAVASAEEAEQAIFALLNQDRKAAGLPPLVWSDLAAKIARSHCEDMRDNGFVAHVSPTTGDASARAEKAGLKTPVVLENVARAYSPSEAETGLMNSPGHRANILSTEATNVGVGVALGEEVGNQRELFVVQMFYRVMPKVDLAAARKEAMTAVLAGRKGAGGEKLELDDQLADIAQWYATALAAGKEGREALAQKASDKLDKLGDRYGAVVSVVQVVGDPAQSREVGKALDADVRYLGVGLAQGDNDSLGEDALYVVVLAARPRSGR
jgi:uncharacterized protein YkwD